MKSIVFENRFEKPVYKTAITDLGTNRLMFKSKHATCKRVMILKHVKMQMNAMFESLLLVTMFDVRIIES